MDIAEARAAVIGAREGAGEEMPILCTMTFDESGRTLTGSDGRIAAVTLAAAGEMCIRDSPKDLPVSRVCGEGRPASGGSGMRGL